MVSAMLPPVSHNHNGRPRPSQARWILVVSRLVSVRSPDQAARTPATCSSPEPPGRLTRQRGRMLVHPGDRRIDRHQPVHITIRVRLGLQRPPHPIPHAIPRPGRMPFPRGLPQPEPLRQIPTRRVRALLPHDRFHNGAVIAVLAPTLPGRNRQQRLDQLPRSVIDLTLDIHAGTQPDHPARTEEPRPFRRHGQSHPPARSRRRGTRPRFRRSRFRDWVLTICRRHTA